MADVIVTLKVMPESPDVDLEALYSKIEPIMKDFSGEEQFRKEEEPVAFGLKALKITFVMDENKGSTEDMEKKIEALDEVNSVDVIDVRRAVG
jgi:elongation factor 1-beta